MSKELVVKDHAEAIALFRAQVIGELCHRELERGELREALTELSHKCFRPPGWKRTKVFSFPTLERWYYKYKEGGLAALRPQPRSDKGHARALTPCCDAN